MWGAVGAGNHFGGFVTCQQLAAHLRGRGVDIGTLAVSGGQECWPGRDLGDPGGPWGSSCWTHIRAERPWLWHLTSLSLSGLIWGKGPRCMS